MNQNNNNMSKDVQIREGEMVESKQGKMDTYGYRAQTNLAEFPR